MKKILSLTILSTILTSSLSFAGYEKCEEMYQKSEQEYQERQKIAKPLNATAMGMLGAGFLGGVSAIILGKNRVIDENTTFYAGTGSMGIAIAGAGLALFNQANYDKPNIYAQNAELMQALKCQVGNEQDASKCDNTTNLRTIGHFYDRVLRISWKAPTYQQTVEVANAGFESNEFCTGLGLGYDSIVYNIIKKTK